MKSRRLVFMAFVALSAFAQEPYTIKQDVLGEPLSVYQRNNKECTSAALKFDKERGTKFCVTKVGVTYADRPVQSKKAQFIHDRLFNIIMTFPHSDFATLNQALTEKFGKATKESIVDRSVILTVVEGLSKKEKTFSERQDIPLNGERKSWSNGVAEISLEEYDLRDTSLQTSSIMFSLNALQKEANDNMNKTMEESQRKTKSDM